jgi:hypothetical protein
MITVITPYPHLVAAFSSEDDGDDDGELPPELGLVGAPDVVTWVVADVVEVEVKLLYNGVDVVVLVDVEDVAVESDVEDSDRLGNELVVLSVEAVILVTEDPVEEEEVGDTDDAIENIGEKFIWVGFASSMISIV